jgi:hypothetical protein
MERQWYPSKEEVQIIVDKLSDSAEELNWDWNSSGLLCVGAGVVFVALVRIPPSSMSLLLN